MVKLKGISFQVLIQKFAHKPSNRGMSQSVETAHYIMVWYRKVTSAVSFAISFHLASNSSQSIRFQSREFKQYIICISNRKKRQSGLSGRLVMFVDSCRVPKDVK